MTTVSAHNAFSLSLYKAFASENEGQNFLLSPVSIFATLSMLLPGAKQETLEQMLAAMQLDKTAPLEVTEAALGKMIAAAVATNASSGELLMANKAYIEAGYPVNQNYVDTLHKYFSAQTESANFSGNPDPERENINKWVATVTKGKIADLLASGSVTTLTRLVLVNALYFKAKWQTPFDPRHTRPAEFETAEGANPLEVPTMHRTGNFPLLYVPEVLTGVRFDFEAPPGAGQRLAMFAVLPAERHRLDALMSGMSPADWLKVLNTPAESSRAAVSLPKVRLASGAELSKPSYLPSLGLASLFGSGSADLSGIASVPGDLFVSSFAHRAVLEWDEFGAEGAAASAAAVNTRSMPPAFNFDQPFLVIVTVEPTEGEVTRVPIFMGRVSDPTKGISV